MAENSGGSGGSGGSGRSSRGSAVGDGGGEGRQGGEWSFGRMRRGERGKVVVGRGQGKKKKRGDRGQNLMNEF